MITSQHNLHHPTDTATFRSALHHSLRPSCLPPIAHPIFI